MRSLLLLGWLLLPVGFGIWHRGPGQERVRLDEVGKLLTKGDRLAADQEWAEAIKAYDEALRRLPAEKVEASRRIRLARVKAQMQGKQLAAAYAGVKALSGEMQDDPGADRTLLAEYSAKLWQSKPIREMERPFGEPGRGYLEPYIVDLLKKQGIDPEPYRRQVSGETRGSAP